MILKLNFWSFFSLHITFYQRLDDRMQAKKAKNALEQPISPEIRRQSIGLGGAHAHDEHIGLRDDIAGGYAISN
jgi:hypothetical protein